MDEKRTSTRNVGVYVCVCVCLKRLPERWKKIIDTNNKIAAFNGKGSKAWEE